MFVDKQSSANAFKQKRIVSSCRYGIFRYILIKHVSYVDCRNVVHDEILLITHNLNTKSPSGSYRSVPHTVHISQWSTRC